MQILLKKNSIFFFCLYMIRTFAYNMTIRDTFILEDRKLKDGMLGYQKFEDDYCEYGREDLNCIPSHI